jgi:predicted MFS family arabinose efflux permease
MRAGPVPKLTNRWSVLALVCAARFGMAVQFQSVPPLAPLLAQDLALSYSQIGTLIGLFMFPGVFIALPGGLLGQRYGDKRVTLAGLALLTLGALLFAGAPSFAAALGARLVGGVGLVLLNIVTTKITTDWFTGKETSTALGIMLTAWPLGIAFSLSTLGTLAAASSWRAALYATAACTAIALVLMALLYADPPAAAAGQSAAGKAATGTAAGQAPEPRRLWRITRRELALVGVIGTLWALINAGYIVFLSFAPAMLTAAGHSLAAAGGLVGLASWTSMASVPLGGWIMDRVRRTDALIVGGILVGAAAMVLATTGVAVAAWMLLFGISSFWVPAIVTLAGNALSPAARHTGFGVFYTLFYAGMALLPPIAGWLQDRTGAATVALLFAAGIMVLAIPVLFVFRGLERHLPAPARPAASSGSV